MKTVRIQNIMYVDGVIGVKLSGEDFKEFKDIESMNIYIDEVVDKIYEEKSCDVLKKCLKDMIRLDVEMKKNGETRELLIEYASVCKEFERYQVRQGLYRR